MNHINQSLLRVICCLAVFVILAVSATGHPGHFSLTELEWNSTSRRFEVAMQLRIADLHDALALQRGRRIDIEHALEASAAIQAYVVEHFRLTAAGHDRCRLHWVGHELQLHDVWIYFEVELRPSAVDGAVTASGPDMLNTVTAAKMRPSDQAAVHSAAVESWDEFLGQTDASTAGWRQLTIRNSMLMDIQPQQSNIVHLTMGDRRQSMILTAAQAEFSAAAAATDQAKSKTKRGERES